MKGLLSLRLGLFMVFGLSLCRAISLAAEGPEMEETPAGQMINAAKEGNIKKVEEWLNLGVDVNTLHEHETALSEAAKMNRLDMVKFLIMKGANPNIKSPYGNPALFVAARIDSTEIVKFLVEHGANVNITGWEKITPLMLAVENYNTDLVKFLVQNGANVNKDKNGMTPLIIANPDETTKDAYTEIIKFLIQNGANANVKDDYGNTALIHALSFNYIDLAKFIIQNGANVNVKDNDGYTPLMFALLLSFREKDDKIIGIKPTHLLIVDELLKYGADPYIEDMFGQTALDLFKQSIEEKAANKTIKNILMKIADNLEKIKFPSYKK